MDVVPPIGDVLTAMPAPEPGRIRERDWSTIPIISSDDYPPDESDGRPVDP